ncbi:AMP-binding protein [Streptomyces sp. SBT349]|uniref:AMP-binding protein n=1 Tax=Streptomyces sp. SBT349 TaxID=1580539 RepID=UPI00066BD5D0|nr:class I adenylate-forming enzyme family protein [Streptomyces sp. SBT349]
MALRSRPPAHIGLVFDWHAQKRRQTVVHLDRPFDIAPEAGTRFDAETLAGLVTEVSDWLYEAGLRFNERVVIVKENHWDMVIIAAAAARIGALPFVMAPIRSVETIRTMIERAAADVVVAGAGVLDRARAAGVEIVEPGVPIIALGEPETGLPPDALRLDTLRGGARAPVRVRSDDAPMIVTHTSGTTGVPKLVMHSAYTALGALPYRMESTRLPLLTSGREDIVASAISFAHMRGLSWTRSQFSLAPRRVVVMSDPSLGSVERVLAAQRPTSLEALPNVFQLWEQLVDTRPELFARVRRFISTFDALHPRTVRRFLAASGTRFPVWVWGLWQSEVAGISANVFTRRTVRGVGTGREGATNVGWPTLARVRVVDAETGKDCPRGKSGILMVKSKTRCLAYVGEDDRHEAKVDGAWWNTGDVGQRLGFGRVRLVDREVDMVPGMSCITLESTLLDRLDRAAEVVVLSMPEGPPVPVLCMRDNTLDPAEWERATRGLPDLAEPLLVPWEDLPRTATWKVRRVELREMLFGEKRGIGTGQWT